MSKNGKRLRKSYEAIDRDKSYAVGDAVKIIKDGATAKFDETIEIAINLAVDPKHADQNVPRDYNSLPDFSGENKHCSIPDGHNARGAAFGRLQTTARALVCIIDRGDCDLRGVWSPG